MLVDDAVQRAQGARSGGGARTQIREKGSRYIDFVIPGLLGMNIMGGDLGHRLRDRRGAAAQAAQAARLDADAAPLFLASFLFSRFVLLVVEMGVILGFAVLVFGVPVRGSLVLVAGVCVLGAGVRRVGLLIASRARTIEGASGLMNLVMLPMWMLSGVFFSSQRFPDAVQPFIQALPLTAMNDALRATMLQGATVATIAPQALVLAAWLLVCFPVALKLFRWR